MPAAQITAPRTATMLRRRLDLIRRTLDEIERDAAGEGEGERERGGRMTPAEFGRARIRPPAPLPYTRPAAAGQDVWDVLRLADAGRAPGTVRLLYTGYEVAAGERDGEYAAGWTREHAWPRSRGGDMSTASPGRGTDAHNLFAADSSVNSARSNRHFCDLPDGEPVVDRSPAAGHDGVLLARTAADAWEPPDSAKGAVARALLYMACAYAGDLRLVEERGDAPGELGVLSAVLRWNDMFPPDERERRRNDVVERAQGNRNPFVDDPALARAVDWGGTPRPRLPDRNADTFSL